MDGDLRLWPLWPALTGNMLLLPRYPVSTTSPHYISLDQLAAFVASDPRTTIGDTPPLDPDVGDWWWDSIGGNLYIWYDDGTSAQWVAATNAVGGGGGPGIAVSDVPPPSPSVGMGWWDSVGGQLYVWVDDGSSLQWVPATNNPHILVSDTPPPNPAVGLGWFDSSSGQLFIWYDDGTSTQWVPATNPHIVEGPAGPEGPQGPQGLPGTSTGGDMSNMVAGQIPIAANATTVTSSAHLSGDITSTTGLVTTLATVNSNVGTFQGLTVNGKGLVTAAVNQSYLTGNQTITVTGDVDGSGTTAITLTLDTVNPNVGTFQGLTLDGKGRVTAAINQNYLTTTTAASTYLPLAGGTVAGQLTMAMSDARFRVHDNRATAVGNGGGIEFQAVNGSGSTVTYASIETYLTGGTAGNEHGYLDFYARQLGTLTLAGRFNNSGNFYSYGTHITAASTTTKAGLNLPHGVSPTSPVNGDMWTTSAGAYVQINGATVGPLGTGGAGGVTFPITIEQGGTGQVTAPLALSALGALPTAGGTMTGKLLTVTATAGSAGLGLGAGANPTSPVHGDLWVAGNGLFFRGTSLSYQMAPLASPAFSGAPSLPTGATAVTQAVGTNSTTLATTAHVFRDYVAKAGSIMTGVLTVNTSGAAAPTAPFTSTILHALSADGQATNAAIDASANISGLYLRRCNNTFASPAGVVNAEQLGFIAGAGHNGTAYVGSRAQISFVTAETWSATANGAKLRFLTTPNTTTTITIAGEIHASGGLAWGSAPVGGDKGAGTINAASVYGNNILLTSDARLKRDIEPVPQGCLELVERVEPKQFRFNEPEPQEVEEGVNPPGVPPGFSARKHWGFVAQDIEKTMGANWGGHEVGPDGVAALSVGDLVATLWQAVRELSAKVQELESR